MRSRLTNFGKRFHFLRTGIQTSKMGPHQNGNSWFYDQVLKKLRPNDEEMKNLYYKIKPISYWNKLKRTPATKSF